nr:transglycosylase domain-containing protein [Oleiagrimonas sp. C23AA]
MSFGQRLNRTQTLALWQVPPLLREAFVASEDKRFWQHDGVDWRARFTALAQNLRAGHVVRGASTIGEQVARILKPRPRTYWSHWMAGFDAGRLLHRFGHARVLAFYLNQVPYGAQRRGVMAAAQYYFARAPDALDPAEQLALAVLVRSPRRYDPRWHPQALRAAVQQLAARMQAQGRIDAAHVAAIAKAPITPASQPQLAVNAGPFVVYARQQAARSGMQGAVLKTTLDAGLQRYVQQALRQRLRALSERGARNAAALVVDNASGAVLAWAVAPAGGAYDIDPVLAPRQPGSTLKPFVYGLAMQQLGWQPDHVIDDAPLAEKVKQGVHAYRNYSGRYYGPVSLRYALANSLNIPAVKTAQTVGVGHIVDALHQLGFDSLKQGTDDYGPAIVLGDGAVPLFDLVQGYASLARHGRFLPLHVLADSTQPPAVAVLRPDVTSVLSSILSDPDARAAEFGADSVLDLPYRTAVKTGTSSDYRDAWTVGFDNRYTVGVWVGRLRGGVTHQLTGSSGPAPVLRQIFAHLRQNAPYAGLWQSPTLKRAKVCEWIGPPPCVQRREWLLPAQQQAATTAMPIRIARPLPGETLALDPRQPPAWQRLPLSLDTHGAHPQRVQWRVDGKALSKGAASWTLQAGRHRVSARVWLRGQAKPQTLPGVTIHVLGGAAPSSH